MADLEQLEKRISQLELTVNQQNNEILDLKKRLRAEERFVECEPVMKTKTPEIVRMEAKTDPDTFFGSEPEEKPSIEERNLARAYENLHKNEKASPPKTQKDMENRVGGMMGIVASLMIFVSIILFVTMVYASMSPILKVMSIFAFSFSILLIGVGAMKRSLNGFTMSLTGCGMGAVYLSLFITHIYFGMINQIMLFLLLLVWAAGVYYFFGKRYEAFKIIGQVGITISVLFGTWLLASVPFDEVEWGKILFLMVYFCVAAWFYLLADAGKSGRSTVVCILLDEIALGCFWMMLLDGCLKDLSWFTIVFVAFLVLNGIFFLWKYVCEAENRDETLGIGWYVAFLLYTAVIFYSAISNYIETGIVKLFLAIVAVGGLLWVELMRKRKDCWHFISVSAIYALLLLITDSIMKMEFGTEWSCVFYGIYGLALLWTGYHFEDFSAVYLSYFTMGLVAVLENEGIPFLLKVILCVAGLFYGGYLLFTRREAYRVRVKIFFYLTLQLVVYALTMSTLYNLGVETVFCNAWAFLLCAVCSIYGCSRYFTYSFAKPGELEPGVCSVTGVVNGWLMFLGSILLYRDELSGIISFLLLVVTGLIYSINVKSSFVRFGDTPFVGIYNGVKLSLFVLVALKAYELSGPIISICWIILAIFVIATGFVLNFKYLRVYGLGLTMFAVCKLLIFDIDYGNPAVRAFSFLLSGLLCFIINLIYHKVQKDE